MRTWVAWLLRQPAVEWFVPADLVESDGVEAYRARLLVGFAYGLTAIGVPSSMIYAVFGVPEVALTALLGALFVFAGPFIMRWTDSLRWGAHACGMGLFATIGVICLLSGGIRAPSIMWFTIVPVFGLIFSGFRGGAVWCLLVALVAGGFVVADYLQLSVVWPAVSGMAWAYVELATIVSLSMVVLVLFMLNRWLHYRLTDDLEEARSQLEYQAYHDRLTEIPNRELLYDRLRSNIERFERNDDPFAFVFIDLDDFKAVNDSLGHATGDRVMKAVAERLCHSVRGRDVVARVGGDEFVVLFESVGPLDDAEPLVERLCEVFEHPLNVGSEEIHLSASIGLARAQVCCEKTEGIDRNMEILRRTADQAMYRAKDRTGTTVEYVESGDRVDSSRRIQKENRIRRGIECGEFVPYYQPMFDLTDGTLVGAEVLARWDTPKRGVLTPDHFLPVIERRALIFEFAWTMIQGVADDIETYDFGSASERDFWVHLNLSPQEVSDTDHLREIVGELTACANRGVEWRFEVTESQWVSKDFDPEPLDRDGIGLVIDDFGKGYSSLGRLADIPCDGLKLDRQFVLDVHVDDDHRALVQIVAELGELLGVPVVAEGVETEQALEVVREAGVQVGQGYYFARPAPFSELKSRLEG